MTVSIRKGRKLVEHSHTEIDALDTRVDDLEAGSSGVTDGDKGDVTVSLSGTVWTIDNGAVTYAKIQDVSATDKVLGRASSGAGDVEEIACTAAGRALLDDASAADQRTTLGAAAASHSHAASDITSGTVDTARLGSGTADATSFLRGDQTWVPSGQAAAKTANQDITSAGWVDVTGLSFAVVDGGYYRYHAFLVYQVSTISMAIFFGVNGPTGTNRALHRKKVSVGISVDGFTEQHLNAFDTSLVTTGEPSTGECLYTIEGSFVATADGTFTIRLDKENVVGTGTVLAGSILEYRRVV